MMSLCLEQHLHRVRELFCHLRQANLTVNLVKSACSCDVPWTFHGVGPSRACRCKGKSHS